MANYNNYTYSTIISGTADNDSIYNWGSNATISGGAGNDTLVAKEVSLLYPVNNVSMIGGTGNDIISLGSYVYNTKIKYNSGDGNDTVYGLKSNDTLQIYGSSYTTTRSGDDVIVNVGSGSILVKNGFTNSFKRLYSQRKKVKLWL